MPQSSVSLNDVLAGLGRIAGALGDDPAGAPLPQWWRSDRVDEVGGGIQISGLDLEIQTPGANHPPRRTAGLASIAGSWMGSGAADLETREPEGWSDAGIEALAWYASYHHAPRAWGVFIRSSGVELVAGQFIRAGVEENTAFRAAFDFLLAHELTHYRVDILLSGAELAAQAAIFLPGRQAQRHRPPGYGVAEEGLANAIGLRSVPAQMRPHLDSWITSSPPGYRDVSRHGSGRRHDSWRAAVGDVAIGRDLPVFWAPTGQPPWVSDVPVFIVQDTRMEGFASAVVGPVSIVGETRTFQRDLRRLARGDRRLPDQWRSCRRKLMQGQLAAGTHLELIDRRRKRFSVRVTKGDRAGLQQTAEGWFAIALDRHDDLYRRIETVPSPP